MHRAESLDDSMVEMQSLHDATQAANSARPVIQTCGLTSIVGLEDLSTKATTKRSHRFQCDSFSQMFLPLCDPKRTHDGQRIDLGSHVQRCDFRQMSKSRRGETHVRFLTLVAKRVEPLQLCT